MFQVVVDFGHGDSFVLAGGLVGDEAEDLAVGGGVGVEVAFFVFEGAVFVEVGPCQLFTGDSLLLLLDLCRRLDLPLPLKRLHLLRTLHLVKQHNLVLQIALQHTLSHSFC